MSIGVRKSLCLFSMTSHGTGIERVLPMLAEPAGGVISLVPSSGAARVYPKAPIRISAADSVKIGAHSRYMMK
jgi:hypothetical protein